MITIKLFPKVGTFAENKDTARNIRMQEIIPALERDENITLDFEKIEGATQSFIHALISDVLRKYGSDALESIQFKSCNTVVQKIITIVTDYMQESG